MGLGRSTALLLLLLLLGLAGCVGVPADERSQSVSDTASRLEEIGDELKETNRRYFPTSAAGFTHLDLGFYDQSAALLGKERFTQLGELADLTHNNKHWTARTFIRVLLSADGTTMAGIYHLWDTRPEMQGLALNDIRAIDLETELSDGSFVITTSAPRQADLDMGPMFDKTFTRTKDPIVLARIHADHVAEYRVRHPELQPVPIRTLDDVIRAQQRQQFLKGSYRQEMEIPFTEDELNHISDYQLTDVVRAVSDVLRSRFPW